MEELLKKHRNELKALQAEIQKIKKSISKGDKKKQKECHEKISALENEIKEKHTKELEEYNLLEDLSLAQINENLDSNDIEEVKSVKSKKKKRKNKINYDEILNLYEANEETSDRVIELNKIQEHLTKLNLSLIEIPADGNCMFNAVAHYCIKHNILDYSLEFTKSDEAAVQLRNLVYEEFIKNKELYQDFLDSDVTEYKNYCNEIKSTRAWGGHLELKALSRILKLPIRIIQSDTEPIIISNDGDVDEVDNNAVITIAYHKHALGLGEHYNACN